jgi:putative transposase
MSVSAFGLWASALGLSKPTKALIERIRKSEPFRRTKGRFNVRGTYPSQKMGRTIQFEAHRTEFPAILEFEHDSDVLEYWDQAGPIKVSYTDQNGKRHAHQHVPDFFLLRNDRAGWVECKTEEKLRELALKYPESYLRGADGQWRYLPGEAYAASLGLSYTVRSNAPSGSPLSRNILFLDDYFRRDYPTPTNELVATVLDVVKVSQGISYRELLIKIRKLSIDDLNYLISRGVLYADLQNVVLVDGDSVALYTDLLAAESIAAMTASNNMEALAHAGPVELTPSSKIKLEQAEFTVVEANEEIVQLLGTDGRLNLLKRCDLEQQIYAGKVSAGTPADARAQKIRAALEMASPENLAVATSRWKAIQSHLGSDDAACCLKVRSSKARSIRRWLRDYRDAQHAHGNGFIGLLPKARPGRSGPHLQQEVEDLISELIKGSYEVPTNPTRSHIHGLLIKACEDRGLDAPSFKTFSARISDRPQYQQIKKRQGTRSAYQRKKFHLFLDQNTPVHGDRPWEVGHIDHTLLDIELVCSKTKKNLGRPVLTLLMDANSRRILAFSLSFFAESSESCMRVLRECVKRHHRLPQILVVDQGKAHESVYFDALLAFFNITKKSRPAAHPRFGSVIERLFGVVNTCFVHLLRGNTQLTKNVRQLTQEVNPKTLAVWTLEELTLAMSKFCFEIYDTLRHPSLGESPCEAMGRAMNAMGHRHHTIIPYDSAFCILTLPTTDRGYAKVHCQKGVHLNYLDYWSDVFLDPKLETTLVPVRYDLWDASVAYAFVKGKWVTCVSAYAITFKNWSQRAVEIASKELRARNEERGKSKSITALQLAKFMTEVAASEEMLLLRACEQAERGMVREECSKDEGTQPKPKKTWTIEHRVEEPSSDAVAPAVIVEDVSTFNISEE